MSLRTRVLLGSLVIAVVSIVVAVFVARTTEDHLIAQIDDQLAGVATPTRLVQLGDARFGSPPPGVMVGASQRLSSLFLGLVTPEGTVETIFAPNLADEATPLPAIEVADVMASAESGEPFTTGSTGSDLRYRVRAVVDVVSGDIAVAALPLDDTDAAIGRLVALELGATLMVLAVLLLVSWWVIRLGVRPIKRMADTAAAIATGDLHHRVLEGDPRTEAGELGVALNQMLGRIEDAFDERARADGRLRQFVADASHELRTPVTTIRGYAELYRAGGLEETGDLAEAMRRTEQEAIRMGALVDDLLQLARLDEGRPLVLEPVDLGQLARDAGRDARAVDPARPIDVCTDATVVVHGDADRLRQVLANLVGNALVHTPPGTPIQVQAHQRGASAVLAVVDAGPGMAPDTAARAFERFYRADPARSRHRGGSGLGLAIVQAVVTAHGGQVELASAPGQGTTVEVRLPSPVA